MNEFNDPRDPFRAARDRDGTQMVRGDEEDVTMILRLKDVRKTAKNWQDFSSDHPLRVLIHSEADVRSVRQLPIEIDPPDHTDYRAIVEPLFRRPQEAGYIAEMETLVDKEVAAAVERGELEAVRGFSLPLQSRAMTRLFRMPDSEADEWISWGVHVFYDQDDAVEEGHFLERYSARQFERAEKDPGEDFFSLLNQADFRGRKLTFEEKQGYASVALSGGRDTVIHTVTSILVYFSEHPEDLKRLRQNPELAATATEEFVRFVSPLTSIARTCPHGANVAGNEIPSKGRVALCWPSANRDTSIFDDPDTVKLDRCPNPHIGFGFGPHACLGAQHARLVIRCLLRSLADRVEGIEPLEVVPKIEKESSYERQIGYETARLRFHALSEDRA
jgi:cytochrome P450